MKHLCCKCEKYMDYESHEAVDEGSVGITFRCSGCDAGVTLVTNAGETMLVRSLGVQIGGSELPSQPLDLTRSTLRQDAGTNSSQLVWSESARQRLERIPDFVRPMAARAIEEFASDRGATEVTDEIIDAYKLGNPGMHG